MKNTLFKKGSTVVLALGISTLFASCGGGGGGSGSTASSSGGTPTLTTPTTAVYVQDSPSVPAGIGIYTISIANTNDGNSCSLFSRVRSVTQTYTTQGSSITITAGKSLR